MSITAVQSSDPRCAVAGCTGPVAFEVDGEHYADALERFYGYKLKRKGCTRRHGELHVFLCDYHQTHDPRARCLHWQELMFY